MQPRYVTAALGEAAAALVVDSVEAQLKAAVEAAAGDMMKLMATALPIAIAAIADVLKKYGFSADQMGALMFTNAIRTHGTTDPEIAAGVNALQQKLMPGIPIPGAAPPM